MKKAYTNKKPYRKPRGSKGKHSSKNYSKDTSKQGWQYVSKWYDGMVGSAGSKHHEYLIPTAIELLKIKSGEHILDIGCGQGVLAPHISKAGAHYTGVDISPNLIESAKRRHSKEKNCTFLTANAHALSQEPELEESSFDAAIFFLSMQDMRYHHKAMRSAGWALKPESRCIIIMTHPAFRVPRQSGWGYDSQRKLVYRRVDSYLSELDVPLRTHRKTKDTLTRSYHRPLSAYMTAMRDNKFLIESMREMPAPPPEKSDIPSTEKRALEEIPLFLVISAVRIGE